MDEWAQKILQESSGQIAKVKSQALTPILVLAATCAASGTVLMVGSSGWAKIFGAILTGLGVLSALAAYCYFAVKDPDRLGSEAFIIQQKHLLMEQKGDKAPRVVDTRVIEQVKEPPPEQLSAGDDGV